MRRLLALLLFCLSARAGAEQVVETFSTKLKYVSGTAVWNQVLGLVHPTLRVVGYTGGSPTPIDLNLGDGSDGEFVQSRYAEFSQNGDVSGNKIRLDLSAYPELNVTNFVLEDGWVLEPVGNAPLIIRSLSDVKIRGEIWCQGHDATVSTVAVGGSGGAGRCGGAAGGNGGDAGQGGRCGDRAGGWRRLPLPEGVTGFQAGYRAWNSGQCSR